MNDEAWMYEDEWVRQRGNPDDAKNPDEPDWEPVPYDGPAKPF